MSDNIGFVTGTPKGMLLLHDRSLLFWEGDNYVRQDIANSHDVRSLRWKVKQLGKQIGKASATIYALRNENAALREAVTWNPGDRARLYNEVRELNVENRKLKEAVAELRDQVSEAQGIVRTFASGGQTFETPPRPEVSVPTRGNGISQIPEGAHL